MGSIGYGEILLILIIALLLFGPEKLPEFGKAFGRAIKEFKKAENEVKSFFKDDNYLEKPESFNKEEEKIENQNKDE
ncbi:MAG: twin-arginine translocase TatA/TatE family subunit [Thermoanaerobaculaceae bacterium]|nr:twin-arginine translocase TatA/TatE family subunit [Thermoanaerobaculaceae bacterium]